MLVCVTAPFRMTALATAGFARCRQLSRQTAIRASCSLATANRRAERPLESMDAIRIPAENICTGEVFCLIADCVASWWTNSSTAGGRVPVTVPAPMNRPRAHARVQSHAPCVRGWLDPAGRTKDAPSASPRDSRFEAPDRVMKRISEGVDSQPSYARWHPPPGRPKTPRRPPPAATGSEQAQ